MRKTRIRARVMLAAFGFAIGIQLPLAIGAMATAGPTPPTAADPAQVAEPVPPQTPHQASAQAPDRVIILSPRVGEVIDEKERVRYDLFPYIRDFKEAIFYRTPANACYALIRQLSGTELKIFLTENVVQETASFIDNTVPESAASGTANAPADSAANVSAGGAPAAPSQTPPPGSNQSAAPPSPPLPIPVPGSEADRLPFAGNVSPESDRSFGIGLGIGTYQCELTGVEKAFTTIEDVYRSSGRSIPRPAAITLGPMQVMTLCFRLNRTFLLACEGGFAGNEFGNQLSNKVKMIGGTAYGHFAPAGSRVLTLFAGLGGGAYSFSFTKSYDVIVASDGSGYDVLEHISLSGGGSYRTVAGGLTVRPNTHTAIDFLVQQIDTGTVSTTTPVGAMSVDLSGVILGVRFTLF